MADDAAVVEEEVPFDPSLFMVSRVAEVQPLARAIDAAVRSGNFPTLRAVGHGAVGQATKAIAVASGYCAPHGVHLAAIIGFDTVPNKRDGGDLSVQTFRLFAR